MKFALLVFTLNELAGMKEIMPRIDRRWVDEILVVDGGSTDGTLDYARNNGLVLDDLYEEELYPFMNTNSVFKGLEYGKQITDITPYGESYRKETGLFSLYQHLKEKNLPLNGFIINQNVPDGYESSNLKQQITDLTGQTVYGTIPYYKSFNIESYVEDFSNFVDISNIGFKNI